MRRNRNIFSISNPEGRVAWSFAQMDACAPHYILTHPAAPQHLADLHDVIRLIHVERFFGNWTAPRGHLKIDMVELRASRARFQQVYKADSLWRTLKGLALQAGCVFEVHPETGTWWIPRDADWKFLVTIQFPWDHRPQLVAVKRYNRVNDDLLAHKVEHRQVLNAAIQDVNTLPQRTRDYVVDLWLTVHGFRGRLPFREYVEALGRLAEGGPLYVERLREMEATEARANVLHYGDTLVPWDKSV